MNIRALLLVILLSSLATHTANAEAIPFVPELWDLAGETTEFVAIDNQRALLVQGGTAIARGVEFENGSIEFDIMFSEQRGFSGGFWRRQDGANFENFYLRPHQSGNPDASQYQPVFNGVTAWQLYYGEGYGAPIEHRFDEWMHVKIEFTGQRANIYVDSDAPVLYVTDLKRESVAGKVGVSASNFAPAYFANFSATPAGEDFQIIEAPPQEIEMDSNTVRSWSVSTPFDGRPLIGVTQLSSDAKEGLTWSRLDAEPTGVTNLARVNGLGENENAVFARINVVAEKPMLARMRFGYSDAAGVYLNDQLIYAGSNAYESRDYRYLGTIGLFDEVVLPLDAGQNEVLIAVYEQFGGWGVMARLYTEDGVRIVPPGED